MAVLVKTWKKIREKMIEGKINIHFDCLIKKKITQENNCAMKGLHTCYNYNLSQSTLS